MDGESARLRAARRESGDDLSERAGRALHWLQERGTPAPCSSSRTARSSLLSSASSSASVAQARYRFHFDNTALAVVEDEPFGPRLLLANDTSHLGPDAAFP